jgi:hypothetical protein
LTQDPKQLRVTEIGEYIRHRSCERRFKLEINGRKEARKLPFAERLFNALDPVLQEAGKRRETEWELTLQASGLTDLTGYGALPDGSKSTPWDEFATKLSALTPGQAAYGREIGISATVGPFHVEGRIDFIIVRWNNGKPVITLAECKASRRDRTYHRLQVAIYRLLVRTVLAQAPVITGGQPVKGESILCVVARIDETTDTAQAILALEPLDLEMEEADIQRLLALDGSLQRIWEAPLEDLPYQLDDKCDGCVFNVHCFPESGRQRRPQLIGIAPSTVRALHNAGLNTLDDLATVDLNGPAAMSIRQDSAFADNLHHLRALAVSRLQTLPKSGSDPDGYQVEALPNTGAGQFPPHVIGNARLVRVYMCVDYDYSENRVGALSAHVTVSDHHLYTGFKEKQGGGWEPDPAIVERSETGKDAAGKAQYVVRPVSGVNIAEFIPAEWSGKYDVDSGVEKQLIQGFFQKMVEAITQVSTQSSVPIHFYVWSRSEMTRLIEACSRVGSSLLGHLRELLGCRESLEQLLYTCMQDDIDRRFALGWTGRGLSVISSLRWYGRAFHWRRNVGNKPISLDRVFTQDLFDFKTDLDLNVAGEWAKNDKDVSLTHKFEIRSRFHDSLTAPYWRAYWHTLPDPKQKGLPANVANAIQRYNEAAAPGVLREYLIARTQALRWLDEGIRFKNTEIEKPSLQIANLTQFQLGIDSAAHAAVDFLRLDQHVKATDWIARHLIPPANRVPNGRTIPLTDVVSHGSNQLSASIDLNGHSVDLPTLSVRCSITEGSFIRLSPDSGNPQGGQTLKQLTLAGKTCKVISIDWTTGQVALQIIPGHASRYVLLSMPGEDNSTLFDHATMDESISDFVAGHVDARLNVGLGKHAFQWFDPEHPKVPELPQLAPALAMNVSETLETLVIAGGHKLAPDQRQAVLDGVESRVQLLQGPPGTGKTNTTAVSALVRTLTRRKIGDVILLAAHTHTAVDNLLQRIAGMEGEVRNHFAVNGMTLPPIRLAKVHSSHVEDKLPDPIDNIISKPSSQYVANQRKNCVLFLGGTTNALLKLARELSDKKPYRDLADRFQAQTLIVDEASMMVFPHFLSLATLIEPSGEIMLSGDHRQLAPIVAHDWEREDRPPAVVYQPYVSAYIAVQNITGRPGITVKSVRRTALNYSFRLPPVIRELLSRLYKLDDIQLDGIAALPAVAGTTLESWDTIWAHGAGLYLVLHKERQSRQSNLTESEIVKQILAAAPALGDASVAIVTPHRAQRALLRTQLGAVSNAKAIKTIDTVERLQGGECPTVIVSATASDPSSISTNVEFILDLNRSNVAFSRAQQRLVVVCAESLLDYIPPELEDYESAMLWKSLRALCTKQVAQMTIDGYQVVISTPPLDPVAAGNATA